MQNNTFLPSDIQKELIDEILAIKPKEIWLFGSFYRGDPNVSSDIDIFVVKKKIDADFHKNLVRLRNELNKFSLKYGVDVDLFIDTKRSIREKLGNNNEFYQSVFNNATKIYSKKSKTNKKELNLNELNLIEKIKKVILKLKFSI